MHRFAATFVVGFCMGTLAFAQGTSNGAPSGNPNNTVPYNPGAGVPASAETPPTHAIPAQTAAPGTAPVAEYSGCVVESTTEKDTLVMSAESVCAKLAGTLPEKRLAGHEIDLKGVLTPRAGTVPASIKVDSVVHVGKSCSDVCALLPPKKRGLGSEIPGKEGGTPGLAPTSPATSHP